MRTEQETSRRVALINSKMELIYNVAPDSDSMDNSSDDRSEVELFKSQLLNLTRMQEHISTWSPLVLSSHDKFMLVAAMELLVIGPKSDPEKQRVSLVETSTSVLHLLLRMDADIIMAKQTLETFELRRRLFYGNKG